MNVAHTESYQVYPSEYAYKEDSVTRTERVSANCGRYPATEDAQNYIHCSGILTDSNFKQEKYEPTDHYVWSNRTGEQLLFIFSTRVSLTTITLHYYSDSVQGLPRLTFYAVPDDFDVWDLPSTSYLHVDVDSVPPCGEPADHRNVSINVNFNTRKVLMYKFSGTSSVQTMSGSETTTIFTEILKFNGE